MTKEAFQPEDCGPFCPHCACTDPTVVWQNGSGETQCDNCGYSETQ